MEEERKDRDGEGWGIGIKKIFFLNFLELLFYIYNVYVYILGVHLNFSSKLALKSRL
jgi:hypothetical protein